MTVESFLISTPCWLFFFFCFPALIYSFVLDILEYLLQFSLKPSLKLLTHIRATTGAVSHQTYDPAQKVRLSWFSLPSFGWKGHPKHNSDIIQPIAQLPVVTGKSEHQSGFSSAWPLIWNSSSASRHLPRMHLSSCRSAVATLSCSLTDCSHCWMLEI